MAKQEFISIYGARVHNLKNIDLEIPRNKLVVFTGLSGSGKSSLALLYGAALCGAGLCGAARRCAARRGAVLLWENHSPWSPKKRRPLDPPNRSFGADLQE